MMKVMASVVGLWFSLAATTSPADAGWTDTAAVAEVNPMASHYYVVRIPVRKNPSSCDDKTRFYQDYQAPGSDKMFMTFLEVLKSDAQVRVYVTGRCNIDGYSEISSVSASR
jgi:hypothetical protein